MDTSSRSKRHNGHSKDHHPHHQEIEDTAHTLLDDGNKVANYIYKHGKETLDEANTAVKKYSRGVWSQANKHPVLATAILGGVIGALGTLLFVMKRK